MCGYREQIEQEIAADKKRIDHLYAEVRIKGSGSIIEIYSQISAIQQTIAAKKQRLENKDKTFIKPASVPSNVTF